jgi:O-acetyl-ADP-ribose deacetylase
MADRIAEHKLLTGQVLALEHGDITEAEVDVIVNAANERLAHGGGVAGAIARRGGPSIQEESNAWVQENGPVSHARPAITGAGNLLAQAIIHAVGPVWRDGRQGEAEALRAAYTSALELAETQHFSSIAFPSISTGIFGFPAEHAADIAIQSMLDFCAARPASALREIRFTLIDYKTVSVFEREFAARFAAEP